MRRAAASRSLPRSLAPRLPAAAHATPPSPWAGTMLHGPARVHEREEEQRGAGQGVARAGSQRKQAAEAASRSSASLDVSAATDRLASEHPQAPRNIAAQALAAAARTLGTRSRRRRLPASRLLIVIEARFIRELSI